MLTMPMNALADTAAADPGVDALSATQVVPDDLQLGATVAAALPSVSVSAAELATIERQALTRSAANSSVLPRVEVEGETVVLSSSTGPRYATLRELGKGGMGEVDLVEDRDIGRTVALKRLLAGQAGPAAVARFVDEVRTIGRLEHPNIVPIHDVGVDEQGRFFFVMKYVDGETLESILERLRAGEPEAVRTYDIPRRTQIFVQVLRALQFAHERGIIHRDLKPANVMVGRFGEVVLMDWGVARTIGKERKVDTASLPSSAASNEPELSASAAQAGPTRASTTRAGALIGTPLYMSPEQARGANDQLDQRADLYSATLMFFEMLALEHPHAKEKTLTSLLHAIQTYEPPNAMTIFADVPQKRIGAEYAHFVIRGLQRDPARRWQSANEMVEQLHLIATGRFHVQCPVTFMKRGSLRLAELVDRSPPLAMWLGITVGLVFLALVANAIRDLVT
jgi:serine/threonine-protein kinase